MKRFFVISYSVTAVLLTLICLIGTVDIINKHQKYGYTYTVTTITGDKTVETIVSLPMNLSFILFLGWTTILLIRPLHTHYKTNKKQKNECGEKNEGY